jgi:hypothetical protein
VGAEALGGSHRSGDDGTRDFLHQARRWDYSDIIDLLTLCACHCANFKVMVN